LSLRQLATRSLCAAVWLSTAMLPAQEQPATLQSLQPIAPQAATANPTAGVLATVHGVVRNTATGEPLPRALVEIEGDAETGTLTDGEGRFELSDVPVGPQTIRVRKPGFHDRPYATEDLDYQGGGPAHNVLVAAEMPDLDFALGPNSAIHGHVELSTGDPAKGIALALLKLVIRNGRAVWMEERSTKTNEGGAYHFAGLLGGVYALFTEPALESEPAVAVVAPGAKFAQAGYPSVFYPEAREFSGATLIRLKDGSQAEANLRLTLEPFYTVTATAVLPNGRRFGSNPSDALSPFGMLGAVTVMDAAGHSLAYKAQFDQAKQIFQASLPDGTYILAAGAASGESKRTGLEASAKSLSPDQEPLAGFAEFTVDGHVVTSLRIPLSDAPSEAVHLRLALSIGPLDQSPIRVAMRGGGLVAITATATEGPMDGSPAQITMGINEWDQPGMIRLSPGAFWISTRVGDSRLCLDSFTAGGVNLAREPLNVALGASLPPMEVTVRDDCAKLALTLPPTLSEFLPGDEPFYTVYVVPDFDTTADIPPMNVHPSSGATFTVDGLTPGNYHVYIFDRPVRLEYRNPAAIAALPTPGQAVTLTAGSTSNLVLEVPER